MTLFSEETLSQCIGKEQCGWAWGRRLTILQIESMDIFDQMRKNMGCGIFLFLCGSQHTTMKRQQVLPWCPRKRSLEQPELGKGQRLTVLAEKLGVPLHSHVGSSPEKKSSPSPLVPISQPTPCSEAKLLSLHRYEEIISTLTFPSYRSLEKETHSQSRVKFCPSHWQSVLDASASIDSSLMASRSRLGLIWEKAVQAVSVCGIR